MLSPHGFLHTHTQVLSYIMLSANAGVFEERAGNLDKQWAFHKSIRVGWNGIKIYSNVVNCQWMLVDDNECWLPYKYTTLCVRWVDALRNIYEL